MTTVWRIFDSIPFRSLATSTTDKGAGEPLEPRDSQVGTGMKSETIRPPGRVIPGFKPEPYMKKEVFDRVGEALGLRRSLPTIADVRNIAIIGVHGWYPTGFLRTGMGLSATW